MKVLIDGDKNLCLRLKRFQCNECGCVFEACADEYEKRSTYSYSSCIDLFYANCPFCGAETMNVIFEK